MPPQYNLQSPQAIHNIPSHCDVSTRQAPATGHTSSPDTPATAVPTTNTVPATRPQYTHRPPTQYADFVYHCCEDTNIWRGSSYCNTAVTIFTITLGDRYSRYYVIVFVNLLLLHVLVL